MKSPLEQLYPSVVDAPDDADLLESIEKKAADSQDAKRAFVASAKEDLLDMAVRLARVFQNGGRLLTMGNGGSSCDAAHVAVEFNHPVTVGRPALPAIHLGADIPMLTAVGNDVGFEQIFCRQVISHGRPGDALLGLSTSGNSDNLLTAFLRAKRDGLVTLGLAGGDGGKMARSDAIDRCVVVPTPSIHRVQECHVMAYHILWDLVHTLLAGHRTKRASR